MNKIKILLAVVAVGTITMTSCSSLLSSGIRAISQQQYVNESRQYEKEQEASTETNSTVTKNPIEIAWERATADNTVESYRRFIDKYPENYRVDDAEERIEQLLYNPEEESMWGAISMLEEIGFYREFLSKYPDGKYSEEAARRIAVLEEKMEAEEKLNQEIEAFLQTEESGTIEAVEDFIRIYPDSPLVEVAHELIRFIEEVNASGYLTNNDLYFITDLEELSNPYAFDEHTHYFFQNITVFQWMNKEELLGEAHDFLGLSTSEIIHINLGKINASRIRSLIHYVIAEYNGSFEYETITGEKKIVPSFTMIEIDSSLGDLYWAVVNSFQKVTGNL